MASRREYIDADWLLGEERPRSALGTVWSGTVFCLFVAGVVVWSWPYMSRWYLQRQFVAGLRQSPSASDAMQSLAVLGSLLPESSKELVEGFCLPDEEACRLAYSLLDNYVQQGLEQPSPNHRLAQQNILTSIARSQTRFSESGKACAQLLTRKIYDSCRDDRHPISLRSAEIAKQLLLADGQGSKSPKRFENALRTIGSSASLSDENSIPTSGSQNVVVSPMQTRLNDGDVSEQESVSSIGLREGSRRRLSDEEGTLERASPARNAEAPVPLTASEVRESSSRMSMRLASAEETQGNLPVMVAMPVKPERRAGLRALSGSSSVVIRAVDSAPNQDLNPSGPSTTSNLDREKSKDLADSQANLANPLQGLEQFSDKEVLQQLMSRHEPIYEAAFSELLRRKKWSQDELVLAVDLARGSTRQRLNAMQTLYQISSPWTISWLVWMAEDGEQEVRERAVSLLGAMADNNAQTHLRLLLHRENDPRVREKIQNVLATAGKDVHRPIR